MINEVEIQGTLDYYQAILAGMESGSMIDSPEIFLRVSRHFPGEALEMLDLRARRGSGGGLGP